MVLLNPTQHNRVARSAKYLVQYSNLNQNRTFDIKAKGARAGSFWFVLMGYEDI